MNAPKHKTHSATPKASEPSNQHGAEMPMDVMGQSEVASTVTPYLATDATPVVDLAAGDQVTSGFIARQEGLRTAYFDRSAKAIAEAIERLGPDRASLDDLVHDTAEAYTTKRASHLDDADREKAYDLSAGAASETNNEGLVAQVQFIIERTWDGSGFDPEMAVKWARKDIEDRLGLELSIGQWQMLGYETKEAYEHDRGETDSILREIQAEERVSQLAASQAREESHRQETRKLLAALKRLKNYDFESHDKAAAIAHDAILGYPKHLLTATDGAPAVGLTVEAPASTMSAHDFAKRLLAGPNLPLLVLDGSNGGGEPRAINLGPTRRVITEANEEDGADCEGLVGQEVLVIGYGCY